MVKKQNINITNYPIKDTMLKNLIRVETKTDDVENQGE
jgi:hypothetical protein